MQRIGVTSIEINNIYRLGKKDGNNDRVRPLKVTLTQRTMRESILKNAKKLKDEPEESCYKRVYLKNDTHPEIRKELKRLYDVFKAEKNKPENAGMEVIFDRKNRNIKCNGEEIDRFRLFSSFH